MKRIQYIFTALAALTVLFACSPERLEETSGSGGQAIVLTALSARNVPDTKTELQDNGPDIWWSAADAIQVFQGSEGARFVSTNQAPALQAEFRGYLPVSTGATFDLWAVYPYDETNTSDGSGITATVPADQKAIAGTFDPTALLTVAHTDNLTLAFQNVCGGLKFQVTQDWIQQVELRSNDGTPLAGKVSVSIGESSYPVVTGIEEPLDAVRLTAPYGETFQPDTWYYLCCLPATLSEGFTLTFRSETQTGVKVYSGEREIERSTWGRLSAADADVDPEEETNSLFNNVVYYTTTNGEVIEPRNINSFGAPFVSNTYNDGRGIIVFDGPVTTIPYGAFENQNTLLDISLPVSVREIGGFAFNCCYALENILIPDGLVSIGNYAFQCSTFTEIDLPGSLQYVSPTAFSGSDIELFFSPLATSDGRGLVIDGTLVAFARGGLEFPVDYEVEAGITGLADRVFENVREFQDVTLPESLVAIGEEAFAYCANLRAFHGKFASDDGHLLVKDGRILASAMKGVSEFVVPGTVREIAPYAFVNKNDLRVLTISSGVERIGEYAFLRCNNLSEVTLPSSLNELGRSAFEGCWNITEFHGKYATTDGKFLIEGGTLLAVAGGGLTEVVVPDGVTTLAFAVFYDCPFVSVSLPDGLTEIGEYAFGWSSNLTGLTLPESLRKIGGYAFNGCQNEAFTSITIPSGVTEVGSCLLSDCSRLTSVRILPTTPPIVAGGGNPIGYGLKNVVLYVPSASLSSYQQADGWRNFSYQALSE